MGGKGLKRDPRALNNSTTTPPQRTEDQKWFDRDTETKQWTLVQKVVLVSNFFFMVGNLEGAPRGGGMSISLSLHGSAGPSNTRIRAI